MLTTEMEESKKESGERQCYPSFQIKSLTLTGKLIF